MVAPQSHRVMDTTRRRIMFSYRLALTLIALMVVLTAAVTGYLVRMQMADTGIITKTNRQVMLAQWVTLLSHELGESTPGERGPILQEMQRAYTEMETIHALLVANARQGERLWHDSQIDDMYFTPPLMVDERVQEYLSHVRGLLHLTPDQIAPTQIDIEWITHQPKGRLRDALEGVAGQEEKEVADRFSQLFNVILGLSGMALVLIVGVAVVVLRPAIAYVEQAQRRLEELNQLKGDFLANMSHEIRTPMNGIFGMTELLLDSALNTRQQHYVRTLQNSADHLLGLINDILDFSKLEAGQMKLDPIRFNLMATIEDVLEILSARARDKQLELLLRYAPDVPQFIVADPGRMRQVFFNLIGNAIKFTDKGYVMVHVEMVKDDFTVNAQPMLRIRVEDTGIGIPENKIGALFEKFMQVETGSARARQGTGLGLAISRNLVNLMGGELSVTSQPNVGTIFSWQMKLPESSKPTKALDYNAALKGKRLLLVDDLAPNRLLYREALMQAGGVCLIAENAREAASILAYEVDNGRTVDAVLTDYMMPGEDGLQLAQRLRYQQRFASLPIVVLTSVGDQGLIKRLDDAGVSACLNKPVARQQLIDTLAHVLDGHASGVKRALITAESSSALSANRLLSRDRPLYGTHVLLVEDNRVNLEITAEILSRLGCEVATAESGMEALKQARQTAFDLIFMDCQMPEMDGFEAARHLVAMKAAGEIAPVPIVALTANALKGDRERCLESGMDDYLSKPVRKANLEAILLKWLREKLEARPKETAVAETQEPPRPRPQLVTPEEKAPAAPAPAEMVDPAIFNNACEMLGDKLGTVVTYYLEDAENFITRIADAVEKHDPAAVVLPAHTLKSSSKQLGAKQVAELAERMEVSARTHVGNGTIDEIAAILPTLRTALQALRPFFESASAA